MLPLAAGINEGGHYSRYIIPRHMCIRVRIFKLMVNSFQFGYIFGVQHQFEVFILIRINLYLRLVCLYLFERKKYCK